MFFNIPNNSSSTQSANDITFRITSGSGDNLPAGIHDARFDGIELFTSKGEDQLLRWRWTLPDGRKASAVTGSDLTPRMTTNCGRFLCMLANKPLSEIQVKPGDYIGKMYTLMVEVNDKGSRVTGFSMKP